jgi:hypothetical protein
MGARGPKPASAEGIFQLATCLYWDLRGLAEGTTREWFNRKAFDEGIKKVPRRLDDTDRAYIANALDREIRTDMLTKGQRQERARAMEADLRVVMNLDHRQTAAEQALQQKWVPGEPDVLRALLRTKDANQIRRICKDAHTLRRLEVRGGHYEEVRVDNWPIQSGSLFPEYLTKHAAQFIEARKDPRFPRSDRPSNQRKQLWFLARALAGAVYGVSTRTAMNLVGSMRPEQLFEQSRAGKPARRRREM